MIAPRFAVGPDDPVTLDLEAARARRVDAAKAALRETLGWFTETTRRANITLMRRYLDPGLPTVERLDLLARLDVLGLPIWRLPPDRARAFLDSLGEKP